ncbi:MAG: response regulator transcription factor [Clostridia bacterium]|nr:response regulator transcription factor [Clostridia bacterium]
MIKILVVEDDKDLNRFVSMSLSGSGYDVISAFDGVKALQEFENTKFDMVLTDIMMPNMDGFELAQNIRVFDKTTPIIFMTAKDDKPSKMLGYRIGIDDYVTKPFDIDVLILKINALLRRAKIESDKIINIGNFTMNKDEHVATLNGNELALTVREFDILFKFLSYPKKTFTRSQLMEEFWDYDSSATSRTVDVYVAKIREKTAGCDGFEIVTVHGLGYKVILK